MIDVKKEMALAEYEAKRDEIDALIAKAQQIPDGSPLERGADFRSGL